MSDTTYILHLKGFVGGADFDRNYVDYVLKRNASKPVNVLIDSLGGDIATALSICSAFRQHGNVNVHFSGMNASAATVASLGAKHISIDKNAMYLVHKCSTDFFQLGSLNADNFRQLIAECSKTADDLDKIDLNIASMYADKCRKDTKDLLALMKVGGWLSAQEVLDYGFVDEITDNAEPAPTLTDATASAMAAVGMPIPNIPLAVEQRETPFAKFLAALSSFFKPNVSSDSEKPNDDIDNNSNNQQYSSTMNKTYNLLCKLLGVENVTLTDNIAGLTEEQLDTIEAALGERDKVIDNLKAYNTTLTEQVTDLQARLAATPAADTTTVVDSGERNPQSGQSDMEQFCNTYNAAKKLLAQVRPDLLPNT